MDTEKAIEKIHEFERFGSVLGLERMTRLLEILGNPQDELKVIHVAGTNGKGSVCRYIYSILQAEGYKTGLYTSPFLEKFNERIELAGEYISDEDLNVFTDKVLAAVSQMTKNGEQSPTEFEVVTAIAFMYFKEKQCDYVILEVGLGGIGDSTNVCKSPLMTVITSVSMDHMDRLGNTIEEIAAEKAGIIKDNCPVVTSATDERALEIIEKTAAEHDCMFFETRHIPVNVKEETLKGTKFDADIQGVIFEDIQISMPGRHQIQNAVAALAAISIMEERGSISLKRESILKGFRQAFQPGRFEVMTEVNNNTVIVIDGAHNADGANAFAEAVKSLCKDKKILMVMGVLADKDVNSILDAFTGISSDFIATEPENPRKLEAFKLAEMLEMRGVKCAAIPDYKEACREAIARSESFGAVVFAGSLYLIGKIRGILKNDEI